MNDRWRKGVPLALSLALAVATVGAPETAAQATVPSARPGEGSEGAWLGAWLSDAVDGGVQVLAVVDGGPAAKAGLRAGDVVIEAGEQPVGGEEELGRVLRPTTPGDRLELQVLRASERVQMTVVLGRRGRRPKAWTVMPPLPRPPVVPAPQPPSESYRAYVYPNVWNLESAGLQVTEITPALRLHYGAPEHAGVLVTRVEPERLAATAGVEVGDVLVGIGGRPIRNKNEVRVNLVRWDVRDPLEFQVVRSKRVVALRVPSQVAPGEGSGDTRHVDAGDEKQRQALVKHQLETQIRRLERRLEELKRELERIDRQH